MFSSEQIFEVSGDMGQLEAAIKFACEMYEIGSKGVTYQITKNGKYCLGKGYAKSEKGWSQFPFDFDVHIIAEIIKQFLEKQECENPYDWCDGGSEKGFLMKAIPQLFSDEYKGIKSPFYGIVYIEPYMNFYAK